MYTEYQHRRPPESSSFAGNAGFFIQETGAAPGSGAYLIYGFGAAVPGLPIGPAYPGATVWVNPIFQVLPLGPVPATGTFVIPIAIPPVGAVGTPVFMQFLNILGLKPNIIELSDALSLTVGLP